MSNKEQTSKVCAMRNRVAKQYNGSTAHVTEEQGTVLQRVHLVCEVIGRISSCLLYTALSCLVFPVTHNYHRLPCSLFCHTCVQ